MRTVVCSGSGATLTQMNWDKVSSGSGRRSRSVAASTGSMSASSGVTSRAAFGTSAWNAVLT